MFDWSTKALTTTDKKHKHLGTCHQSSPKNSFLMHFLDDMVLDNYVHMCIYIYIYIYIWNICSSIYHKTYATHLPHVAHPQFSVAPRWKASLPWWVSVSCWAAPTRPIVPRTSRRALPWPFEKTRWNWGMLHSLAKSNTRKSDELHVRIDGHWEYAIFFVGV